MKLAFLLAVLSFSCLAAPTSWQKPLAKKWDMVKAERFYNKGSYILRAKKDKTQYLLLVTKKNLGKKSYKSISQNLCKNLSKNTSCDRNVLFAAKGASFVAPSNKKGKYYYYMLVPSKIQKDIKKEHSQNILEIAQVITGQSKGIK